MCCGYGQGSFTLIVDGSFAKSGGQFASSDEYTFGSCSGEPPVTQNPTSQPTALLTKNPTSQPTDQPVTLNPTEMPSALSTKNPTLQPTRQPSRNPTNQPTSQPFSSPTNEPTSEPSNSPSKTPSANPTAVSTNEPTNNPTNSLTTNVPTSSLTNVPTLSPTNQPSADPTLGSLTSSAPTNTPTSEPTNNPTTTQQSNQPTPALPLTVTPTSLQPTYLPTDNPTVTPEATTLRTIVCGMNNKCSANEQTVEKATVQAVRCCRDGSHGGSGGWPFKCRSDSQVTYSSSSGPWGQSKMGIIPDNLMGTVLGVTYKCVETDFEGAVQTCEANNARLCTPQEVSDRCTRGTGCNFNSRLVWTCIAGEDECSNDAECCSGTCGADGTCTAIERNE